jgi:hypothetical protein
MKGDPMSSRPFKMIIMAQMESLAGGELPATMTGTARS